MNKDHVEEYLGAIYRLRANADLPLPLARLQEYLAHTSISIHEMVQKLEKNGFLLYTPYRGVVLTAAGESIAAALVRRHRIWERFLTDSLAISSTDAHKLAGELEHAVPELVTERLALFLGDPSQCPHGSPIPARRLPLPEEHPAEIVEGPCN
jgi:DtxR family transcriptional regulator, Mn-dependent transcriptional regulator